MYFILDSWLDNKTPFIRVMSKETGQTVLEFKGGEIQNLLEQQVIDAEDLYSRNRAKEKEMIFELFLYAQEQNKTLQNELMNRTLLTASKKNNMNLVANTFNRLESIRETFFAHKPLKIGML